MKKWLIVKPIVISFLIVIIFLVSSYFIVGAVSPKTISNLTFRINAKITSVNYAEKAYLKDNSIDNLATLIERSIYADDKENVVKYSPVFLSSSEFDEYKNNKSGNYELYIVNKYITSLYGLGGYKKAVEVANSYTDFNNYDITNNPTRVLIINAYAEKDKSTLTMILDYLENSTEKPQAVLNDIDRLNEIISGL